MFNQTAMTDHKYNTQRRNAEDPDTLEGMDEVSFFSERKKRRPSFSLHKTPCEMEMPINATGV